VGTRLNPETDDTKTIEQIAVSTNSQNRIHPRDLRANDDFQVQLEYKLKEKGIKYIRKRGGFDDYEESMPQLDALKAGQLIRSYIKKDPTGAKRQSDHIFNDWYHETFSSVDIDRLVRAYNLYLKIEEQQKFIADEVRIRGISRTENTFITYGGYHVLTLCGILEEVFPKKTDDELINEAIKIIAEVLHEAGQPAYYSFFRNTNMMDKMIEKCSQESFFKEMSAA